MTFAARVIALLGFIISGLDSNFVFNGTKKGGIFVCIVNIDRQTFISRYKAGAANRVVLRSGHFGKYARKPTQLCVLNEEKAPRKGNLEESSSLPFIKHGSIETASVPLTPRPMIHIRPVIRPEYVLRRNLRMAYHDWAHPSRQILHERPPGHDHVRVHHQRRTSDVRFGQGQELCTSEGLVCLVCGNAIDVPSTQTRTHALFLLVRDTLDENPGLGCIDIQGHDARDELRLPINICVSSDEETH
eukprot:CAMPEP_0181117950 /NCGR_PEP_ID=MMETSP1071-20121207/22810_1 /TAXON_ID=35127 /ORGANISM="Thalassiosira sp., Strain NH16" /LENGTH=244 /DNA_ID=CAMNT_0023202401 /DNA_START=74 /DNA_END=806 /DNA_ORIENTATION=+